MRKSDRKVTYRATILGEGLKCDVCLADATVVKKIDLYMETRNSHRQIGYCSKHNPEKMGTR